MGFGPLCLVFAVCFTTFKMMSSYICLEESYLQHRLSFVKKEENTSLKKGKNSSGKSYMLMGTTDPIGILEKDKIHVKCSSTCSRS